MTDIYNCLLLKRSGDLTGSTNLLKIVKETTPGVSYQSAKNLIGECSLCFIDGVLIYVSIKYIKRAYAELKGSKEQQVSGGIPYAVSYLNALPYLLETNDPPKKNYPRREIFSLDYKESKLTIMSQTRTDVFSAKEAEKILGKVTLVEVDGRALYVSEVSRFLCEKFQDKDLHVRALAVYAAL